MFILIVHIFDLGQRHFLKLFIYQSTFFFFNYHIDIKWHIYDDCLINTIPNMHDNWCTTNNNESYRMPSDIVTYAYLHLHQFPNIPHLTIWNKKSRYLILCARGLYGITVRDWEGYFCAHCLHPVSLDRTFLIATSVFSTIYLLPTVYPVYPMSPVSLDRTFLIATSVFTLQFNHYQLNHDCRY